MEMTTKQCKWAMDEMGTWISFHVTDGEARAAADEMNQHREKEYSLILKQKLRRRSLDANAYFWVLVGKLAGRLHIPKTDIYRGYVQEMGDNFVTVCVTGQAAEDLKEKWESNGLGWVAELFDSKIEGCRNVHLYYGSSTYDAAQMSRLIDLAVQDCKAQGIETLTNREIRALLEDWHDTV